MSSMARPSPVKATTPSWTHWFRLTATFLLNRVPLSLTCSVTVLPAMLSAKPLLLAAVIVATTVPDALADRRAQTDTVYSPVADELSARIVLAYVCAAGDDAAVPAQPPTAVSVALPLGL